MSPSLYWQCRINNPKGIHCRVAGKLTEIATSHEATVEIIDQNSRTDCTSILEILSLGLTCGSQVEFTASGAEAVKVREAITRLLADRTKPADG